VKNRALRRVFKYSVTHTGGWLCKQWKIQEKFDIYPRIVVGKPVHELSVSKANFQGKYNQRPEN